LPLAVHTPLIKANLGFKECKKLMMKEILKKRLTIIVLGLITIAEVIMSGEVGGSLMLWLLYGLYKFFTW
jgi:hypothetical protein